MVSWRYRGRLTNFRILKIIFYASIFDVEISQGTIVKESIIIVITDCGTNNENRCL